MATPAPAEPLPTTPPSTYILTTTGEGALLTSLASGGIATRNDASSYSRSAYSHSTPGSDHTVIVGGSGNGSGTASGSGSSGSGGLVSGWNNLSNTTKYAIYAGAGVAVLLIIALIIFVARRSRRKRRQPAEVLQQGNARKDARMTQRSSFASPMQAMDSSTLRSNHNLQQGPPAGNDGYGRFDATGNNDMTMMMQLNDSSYSMDKSGGAFVTGDNCSVRSVPPMYGHASQQAQYHPDEAQYPPTSPEYSRNSRTRAMSPALSQHSSAYGHAQNARPYGNGYAHQQQEHQEEQLAYGYDHGQGQGHHQQQYQQEYDNQYSSQGRPQQQQQQQYPPHREYQQHPPRQGSQYSQQGYGY